jgi:hypothetical protein
MHTKYQSENLKETDNFGELGVDGRIMFDMDLKGMGC